MSRSRGDPFDGAAGESTYRRRVVGEQIHAPSDHLVGEFRILPAAAVGVRTAVPPQPVDQPPDLFHLGCGHDERIRAAMSAGMPGPGRT